MALHFVEKALTEVRAGNVKVFEDFDVPDEAIGCGFHEAVRGVLSHHLVIRDGKIANYHPYPPTPWNGSPTDSYGTPGPYEDAVMGMPIFEENGPRHVPRHRHHAGGPRRSTRACRAGCTCTWGAARRSSRCTAHVRRAARMMDDRELVGRMEALLERVEDVPEAVEVAQALLDLYGEGLRRIVARVDASELADDELVSHLLLLHDLHPVPVEQRVRAALADVRPYLGSHGGDVELLGVSEGVARLRLEGSCSGCPSSTITLRMAIEEAIYKAAPDVERVEAVDGPPAPVLLQIDDLTCPLPMAGA